MIIDIIIIALIALCIITGYKKGLIEVAFNLVSFILSIILSLMLYIPVSNYIIENTEIDNKIKETIEQNISAEEITKIEENQSEELPEIISNYISKTITDATNEARDNIAKLVAENLSITAVKIVTLILLFIIIRIILLIIKRITNAISKLPIINSANKIGGIIYGALQALLIIYLALAIAMAISTITGNTEILKYINESNIGKMMFNNNILLKIIFP